MLAFDIETLGMLKTVPLPPITCVCLYDAEKGISHKLRFYKVSDTEFEQNRQIMLECLDAADRLAGYNAVHFDIPYIALFFQLPAEQVTAWILKCADPFMVAKYILKNTCGLNHLLALNGLGSKTGSGGDAITLALQGDWDSLLSYCLMDARLTYELCALPAIAFSPFLRAHVGRDDGLWHFHMKHACCAKTTSATTGAGCFANQKAFVMETVPPYLVHHDDDRVTCQH